MFEDTYSKKAEFRLSFLSN